MEHNGNFRQPLMCSTEATEKPTMRARLILWCWIVVQGSFSPDPGVLQACPAHTRELYNLGVLARVMCSDQIASYIRDIDPTNVLKKNMLRSIKNCPLCAVKSDNSQIEKHLQAHFTP